MAGDDVSAVLAAVSALQIRVDAWRSEAAHDEDETRSLRQSARDSNQAELEKRHTDLMARMDRLQDGLEETWTRSGMVSAMQRQVRRIAAQAFGPENDIA